MLSTDVSHHLLDYWLMSGWDLEENWNHIYPFFFSMITKKPEQVVHFELFQWGSGQIALRTFFSFKFKQDMLLFRVRLSKIFIGQEILQVFNNENATFLLIFSFFELVLGAIAVWETPVIFFHHKILFITSWILINQCFFGNKMLIRF